MADYIDQQKIRGQLHEMLLLHRRGKLIMVVGISVGLCHVILLLTGWFSRYFSTITFAMQGAMLAFVWFSVLSWMRAVRSIKRNEAASWDSLATVSDALVEMFQKSIAAWWAEPLAPVVFGVLYLSVVSIAGYNDWTSFLDARNAFRTAAYDIEKDQDQIRETAEKLSELISSQEQPPMETISIVRKVNERVRELRYLAGSLLGDLTDKPSQTRVNSALDVVDALSHDIRRLISVLEDQSRTEADRRIWIVAKELAYEVSALEERLFRLSARTFPGSAARSTLRPRYSTSTYLGISRPLKPQALAEE